MNLSKKRKKTLNRPENEKKETNKPCSSINENDIFWIDALSCLAWDKKWLLFLF